jgi:signal transduction histidine kinase
MYGALAHYFNIYGIISFRFNGGLLFTAIFLALFVQALVDTKTKYKTEHQFLNSVIILLSLNFLYGIIDLGNAIALIYFTLNYAMVIFFSIGISIYRKGNKIITIFLFAHIFYLIFNVYGLMFYRGLVDFSYISFHGIGIGIMIEALMLSYLVSYKFKIIEEEKVQERLLKIEAIKEQNKAHILLLRKSKMADMGEMIGNIAHQWRQPLAVIGISVGILRERKLLNRLTDKDFEEELGHIDLNILHMSQTIEDFMSYFSPNKAKEDFYIAEAVDKSLLIIGNIIYKENITISKNIDKEYSLYGFKEEYIQVLISILTNAIYALKDQEEEKIININLLSHDKVLVLEISDNAGGISEMLIDKIFEPYFTTKDKSIGTGLGLYIAKTIIESSMNGSLKVVNTKEGAKFSIIII